jgi:hypothetical protein
MPVKTKKIAFRSKYILNFKFSRKEKKLRRKHATASLNFSTLKNIGRCTISLDKTLWYKTFRNVLFRDTKFSVVPGTTCHPHSIKKKLRRKTCHCIPELYVPELFDLEKYRKLHYILGQNIMVQNVQGRIVQGYKVFCRSRNNLPSSQYSV